MKALTTLLSFIAILSSVAWAQNEPENRLLVDLTIVNEGAEHLGLADGTVPAIYRDRQKTPTSMDDEVWAETRKIDSNILRLQFLKPLVIKLVDSTSGEERPPRILRFVDLILETGMVNSVHRVARQGPVDVVTFSNIAMAHVRLTETLEQKGPDAFILGSEKLPEIYRIEALGLRLSLGDLSSSEPHKPYWLGFEARKIVAPDGTMEKSIFTTSKVFISMTSINQHIVQDMLTKIEKVNSAALPEPPKPSAEIIPFPGKFHCHQDLKTDDSN